MKRFLAALVVSAAMLQPISAYAFWGSDDVPEMNFEELSELYNTLHMYEESFAQDFAALQQRCTTQTCLFVGLTRLYSQNFRQAGYNYDGTVRAYLEAMTKDPMVSNVVFRARMDDILVHLVLLARQPVFEAERAELLKDGTLTEATIKAAREFEPK